MKSITYIVTIFSIALAAQATNMASTNYRVSWDVAGGGGGLMTSASYVLTDTVGQPSAIGSSSSTNYFLQAGFQAPPDTEGDLIKDFMDNCILDPNTDQYDSNNDGFGSICDADLNNDLIINFLDLTMMRTAFFTNPSSPDWNPDADFDNSGIVNFADLFFMEMAFFTAPGPSGIAP